MCEPCRWQSGFGVQVVQQTFPQRPAIGLRLDCEFSDACNDIGLTHLGENEHLSSRKDSLWKSVLGA